MNASNSYAGKKKETERERDGWRGGQRDENNAILKRHSIKMFLLYVVKVVAFNEYYKLLLNSQRKQKSRK